MNHVLRDQDSMRRLLSVLMALPIESKPYRVTVEEYQSDRTGEQLAYFWICCRYISRALTEAGHTCSEYEIHDIVLGDCFGWRKNAVRPHIEYPAKTLTAPKKITLMELSAVIEKMHAMAGDKGMSLPAPTYENAA